MLIRAILLVLLTIKTTSVIAADSFQIAALYWSANIPCQVYMSQGLEKEASKLQQSGLDISLKTYLAGDGPAGIENQIQQMNDAINQPVDLIIVQPTDNAALAKPLLRANQQGIPVIAYDQYIQQGQLLSYVTSDNYMAGYYNGEYIANSYRNSSTNIKLVLVEYPHVSSTVERLDGFLDALNHYQQPFTILKSYTAVEPTSGAAAGQKILSDFPDRGSIDVIFTVNDGGGLNVVNALAAANRHEIVVATIDGDPKSIRNIQQQRLTVIDTAQFCGPMGAHAMALAALHLQQQAVPPHVLLPVYPITVDTLTAYPGWEGPIPNTFTKPWHSDTPLWINEIREPQ